MHGAIVAELRSFYEYHNAEDLWEESVGRNIERNEFYNDSFFRNLVHLLSVKLNNEPQQTLQSFGEFIAPYLLKLFPINTDRSIIDLLCDVKYEVNSFTHEIQLIDTSPFNVRRINGFRVEMVYHSRRNMPELRKGIILGLAKVMKQEVTVKLQKLRDFQTLIVVEKVS